MRMRSKGCYARNAGMSGIIVSGDNNLIDDLYVCSVGVPNMDYYIAVLGGNGGTTAFPLATGNVIRNSTVVRDPADSHTGHGISIKSNGRPLERTLIEHCSIDNVAQAIELRHHESRYTIARDVVATGNRSGNSNFVTFRDDTSENTVENSLADGVYVAIQFTDNVGEDGGNQPGGHHNRVINTVFNNCKYAITSGCIDANGVTCTPIESTGNELLNCTFYRSDYMFGLSVAYGDTNPITNCNIFGVGSELYGPGTPTKSYSHSNVWQSWVAQLPGTSNQSVDPLFVDATKGDFHLQSSSPVRDKGADVNVVHYDKDGVERTPGAYSVGAYQ